MKILGTACGLGVSGSGWVADEGLVVTNAHVVAGERDTHVLLRGQEPSRPAQPVYFDPRNDVAILRVDGLDAPVLPLARDPDVGTSAAILGFPLNGPFDVRAGRLGETRRVSSSDAYGRGPVERSMTALRGLVRPGNSGGPMVDGEGRVVTTIFAATTRGPRGGYGVPNSVVRRALRQRGRSGVDRAVRRIAATLRSPMGKTLVIAEKPSVGRDYPASSPARSRSTRATSRPTTTS